MRGIEYRFDQYENDTKKKTISILIFSLFFFYFFFISLNLATDFLITAENMMCENENAICDILCDRIRHLNTKNRFCIEKEKHKITKIISIQ